MSLNSTPDATLSRTSVKSRRIVIVDSDATMLYEWDAFLKKNPEVDYTCLPYPSAEKALIELHDKAPDCILLAAEMQEMSGLEFLDRLTKSTGKCDYPVVMLAGEHDEWTSVQALKLGAQDYLIKENLAPAYLAHAIETAIEKIRVEKELEHQRLFLAKKNKELRIFAAASAYSLRNPIKVIKDSVAAMREMDSLSPDAVEELQQIWESAARANRLVDDVITYAQMSNQELVKTDIDLKGFLADIEREFAVRIEALHAELQIHVICPFIRSDKVLLHLIISNLIDNALTYRHSERTPKITVKCKGTPTTLSLIVRDNGLGIDPELQQRLLTTDLLDDTDFSKSGIGFAIVRKAIELLGGKMNLSSTPGIGSEFILEFPV